MIVKFFLKRENQDFFYWVLFLKKEKRKKKLKGNDFKQTLLVTS